MNSISLPRRHGSPTPQLSRSLKIRQTEKASSLTQKAQADPGRAKRPRRFPGLAVAVVAITLAVLGHGQAAAATIGAGYGHSLALKPDGIVVAWGDNEQGQLNLPAGLSQVKAVTGGYYHNLALKADGTVAAWGDNSYAQCIVPGGLSGVTAAAAGGNHSLALKADGTVAAWGDNRSGQCNVPADLSQVSAVAGGEIHSLALKGDGTVVAWGSNSEGQGNVPAGLSGVTAVAAGAFHNLALKSDGTVVTWGSNAYGQCNVPADLNGVIAVAAGKYHSLALKADGSVVAWGDNRIGQCEQPAGLSGVIEITAGQYHSLALKADGAITAWGWNDYGQNTVPAGLIAGPTTVSTGMWHGLARKADGTVVTWGNQNSYGQNNVPAGLRGVKAVAAGYAHSLALKADGTVVAWGYNNYGQCNIPAGLKGVIAVASGMYHSLALKADGTLVAWGLNSSNQCNVPAGLNGVKAVAVGPAFNLALKADGTVVAWGINGYLQCRVPTRLIGVITVAAGGAHSLALQADNTVVGWGSDYENQINFPSPTQDWVNSGAIALAGGEEHSVFVKADGTVVACGNNYAGACNVPSYLNGVIAVAAPTSAWHNVALKANGTGVAWGNNSHGQCNVPVLLPDVTPPTGTLSINGGVAYTKSAQVTLNLTASDTNSGVDKMQFSNDGSTYTAPETFAASKSWTLSDGDGVKTVYAKLIDKTGNVSPAMSASVTLDTAAPTGSIGINGGSPFTNNPIVNLSLSATDGGSGLDKMQFSNNGVIYSSPQAYAESANWTLTAGDGAKTVYVQFIDKAGNTSTPFSASITIVTAPPSPFTISMSPTSLAPSCLPGQNAAGQSFEVWNSGSGSLSYSISKGSSWISIAPAGGNSTGNHNSHTISYNTSGMAPGTYNDTITISAIGTANSPQNIPVTLTIHGPHTITATAGPHGSITPSGAVPVNEGGSQGFAINPDTNYNIKTVLVDGVLAGPVPSYTFNNVTADHSITASFVATTVSILTDKDKVRVPPGNSAPLQVKLSDEPQANAVVTVAWVSGSPALSIKGVATLTFTPANWNTYQTVQIAATPDKNDMNATAVFELSAPGQTGKQVTAIKGQTGGISPILYLLLESEYSEHSESQKFLPLLENTQKPEPPITGPVIQKPKPPITGPDIRKLDQ